MPLVAPYELDNVSVGASELSLVSGTTTLQAVTDDGLYHAWLDPIAAALANGDEFALRVYEKVLAGSTKRLVYKDILRNPQSSLRVYPDLMLLHGWDFTLQKLNGSDRSWDAEVRGVTGAISEAFTQSALTVSTTELSLLSGTSTLQSNTTAGYYQVWLDPIAAGMVYGDTFVVRLYEKVEGTGGTKRVAAAWPLMHARTRLWVTPPLHLRNGWDVTMQRTGGANRDFDVSIRKVA